MNTLIQDLRYSLRALAKARGMAAVAILALGLAIGANTAMFSVVNGVLLRPEAYREPDRVVLLLEQLAKSSNNTVSYQNYVDYRSQSHSFEEMAAARNTTLTLTGRGDPERLPAEMITANLFSTLDIEPELGRSFTAEEDKAGAAGVAMISHSLWQRRFAGHRGALGQNITLDNKSYTIIGVAPAGYRFLQAEPDVLVAFEPWARTLPDDRAWHPGIIPVARLKAGVTVEDARAEAKLIAQRLEKQYPLYNTGTSATVVRIHDQLVQNVRPALLVLMAAVGFVLLIACTNVANLLLARAAGRQREIAIRAAIGASRARILRQLLTESVVLALGAAALGIVLASAAMPPLVRLAGTTLPGSTRVALDMRALGFTILIALIAGIAFGLAPARHGWSVSVRDALSESDRGGVSRAHSQLRSALVVTEVAVAMLLLVGAGLLLRSFEKLSSVSPGFSTDHILIADLPVTRTAFPTATQRLNFYESVLQRAASLPGVQSAGAASFLPVSGQGSAIYFNIEGRPPRETGKYSVTNYRIATAGYLKALQIPLRQGRWLSDGDREDTPIVVVINERFAKQFFPDISPLGQHVQMGGLPDKDIPWMEVVGVVGDTRADLGSDAAAELYVPYRQAEKELSLIPVLSLSYVMRTSSDPLALAGTFQRAVHEINPNQPVVKVRSMEENLATSVAQPRFRTVLLAMFAGVALGLAALGIFSVMAYTVTQRTRELGVRIALGASRERILELVLRSGLGLTFAGVVIGLGASLVLTRYLSTLLFQVGRFDALTLAIMAAIVVLISVCACLLPARRATKVDPVVALRYE